MNVKSDSLGRQSFTIAAAIVAATFLTSLLSYSQLPESIITHWNAQGVGDGHGPRNTVFLIPIVSLGLIALFYYLPKIEPKKNIYKFKSQYTGFMNVTLLFMLFFNGITIAINMGIKLDLNRFLALGTGCIFYFSAGTNPWEKVYKVTVDDSISLEMEKPVKMLRGKRRSKYDPILDQFLEGGHDLVEIDVKGRNPIYVKSQLRRRIKDRKLEIATSSAGSFVYLERISSQARA